MENLQPATFGKISFIKGESKKTIEKMEATHGVLETKSGYVSKVSKEVFEKDLNSCLTIIKPLPEMDNENYTHYECEYISPALHKRNIIVAVF
jgi:hypothetical protein